MTDQQTAWTPGPWCVQRHGDHVGAVWTGTDPETHGQPLCEVHRRRGGMGATDWLAGSAYMRLADAQLVALAPRMAAAIRDAAQRIRTHAARSDRTNMRPEFTALLALDDRLRGIGGDR